MTDTTSKSFFLKLKLSAPLLMEEFLPFIDLLQDKVQQEAGTCLTFFLNDDIQIYGTNLETKVPPEYINEQLSAPEGVFGFSTDGKYDPLLRKLKQVLLDFSKTNYPDKKIVNILVAEGSAGPDWVEIP